MLAQRIRFIHSTCRALGGKVVIPGNQEAFNQIAAKGISSILSNPLTHTEESKIVFYYTATWCPPCKAIAPVYEKLSEKYPNLVFTKVDVDQLPEAAAAASIRGVPTFIFKHNGNTLTEVSY
jgi:thiol-disulfide isomerase/thioredoxin